MRNAVKITFIYVIVSSLWILLSDHAVALLSENIEIVTRYASIKGLMFVVVTSVLLFLLILKDNKAINKIISKLNRSEIGRAHV